MVADKLKIASDTYMNGYTCSQAVFSAFAKDMGVDDRTAYRLFEGFGGGFGGKQEVCGAFTAAIAVISYHASSGSMNGESKADTFQKVRQAIDVYEREYGSIRCKEILKGSSPKAFGCGMKVKDAVLMASQMIEEMDYEKKNN